MEYINWLIYPLLIFFGAQYLLGPIMVYFNQKLPIKYRFNILDSETFLKERGSMFRALHEQILSSGFRYVDSSELKMSHSALYFSIYYSEELKLTCTLMTAHATHNAPFTQIEFTQIYDNGTLFGVNNNAVFGAYPKWSIKDGYRFPSINDFNKLLIITHKLISRYKSDCSPVALEPGSEFQTIENHLNDEVQHLIKIGWVSPKQHGQSYHLTIKGAVIMTWKMCWPIKGFLNNADVKRSETALRNA
ncbi:MAG: hypothetical protein GY801_29965 [bacterium]|nr:hypothetical protein [bacterium]